MGKKLTSQFFPRGKNGPARFFPGEKTDWGEVPACYTGLAKVLLVCLAGPVVNDNTDHVGMTFVLHKHKIVHGKCVVFPYICCRKTSGQLDIN